MKWIIVETSIEGTISEFGDFDTLKEAISFTGVNKFPWSDNFLSCVSIRKVSNDYLIKPDIYKDTQGGSIR
jgi:hypothetical protein